MSYEDPSPPILLSLYKQNLIKPVTRSPVPCRIKSNGTLCLGGIISVFTESITEEHAWAVIYGSCKTLEEMLTTPLEGEKRNFYFITSPSNIQIHVDGKVHPNTYLSAYDTANQGSRRKLMTSVDEAIAKQLTPGLENLLELMLSSDSEDTEIEEDHRTIETDDEGIEQDHDDLSSTQQQSNHKLSHNLSFLYRVLNLCTNHLSVSKEADLHFKNRVQNRDLNQAKEIQELALLDWACLWKETMFQLRQGVKLKKTDYTKTPIEYGLTPYEILMDDIRSRRYKLNKVLVNGDLPPKVKKDAHDIILDFIRSRPPLKPASRRVLPPKKLNVTPQELLMKSICSPSAKASLKKTPGPPSPKKSFIEGYPKSIIPSIYTSDELDSSYPLKEKKPTSPKKLSNSSSLLSLTRKQRSSILYPHFLKFDPYDEDDDFFSSPLSPELKRSPSNSPTANKHNVFSSGMGRSHIQRRSEASLNKFVTNLSPILPEARRVSYTSPSDADSVKLRQLNLAMTSTPNILGSQGDSFISPQCSPKLNSKISRRDDWSIFNKCDLSLEEK
ncbi:SPIR [Lepeophtheirus salmonis]|uniref:SPIR n=1 Tax=Lepeophtheirus salmonis TaxID=72036 RepID=A0A7R8H8U4_LEPSM|nr:SPIR [Lepeophtheirus salmonis]CAF2937146.1 SPIR [Lepeophtheirus salmonis]